MPWTAAEFTADKKTVEKLHGVKGIPMLTVFSIGGEKLSANATGDVTQA